LVSVPNQHVDRSDRMVLKRANKSNQLKSEFAEFFDDFGVRNCFADH